MPSTSLQLSFFRGAGQFMRLVINNIQEFTEEELCAAANWILQAVRKETVGVTRLGYAIDGSLFEGVFERELDLTTNFVFSLLNDAVIFHHREIRFSVDEGQAVHKEGMTTLFYVREDHRDEEPKNSSEFDSFLQRIEARQRSLLENSGQSYLAYLANDADSMVSFTEFLRKLENRQQAIMSRFPFHRISFSAETTTIGTPENSPIEIGREVFPEDVFHSQLPCPDGELFFDTASEPFCDTAESFDKDEEKVDIAGYLKNMLDDVIQKLDRMEDEKLISFEEALVDHDVRTAVDYFSQREKDSYMSSVESFKQKTPEKASLSMTVATSTDVEGKKEHVQVETQTDKDSSDSGEEAAIRECLRTILHRKKMSSSGKKTKISKEGVEDSKVIKKTRPSKSPKCSCSEKKKDEIIEEVTKKEKVNKVEKEIKKAEKEIKKMTKEVKKEEKESKKEEKKEEKRELKKQKKEVKETLKAERRKVKKCLYDFWQPEETKREWCLGEEYPKEWFKSSGKSSFDLMAELEKALPTSSENHIEEPFNRKLREKWAHDGMKSLKMPTPISSIRLPQRHPTISRLDRFQRYSTEEIHDQVMDMYNLVRVDNVNYKIVPRHLGASSGLHRIPKSQSTAPVAVHLAVVDESDPWLNWENHYFKVFRVQNVGNKIVKNARLEIVHSQNATISRDLSKIPDQISVDYNVDLELLFSLSDRNKDGLVVMQMKNAEGGSLSTPFAFVIPKIDIPYEMEMHQLQETIRKFIPREPVKEETPAEVQAAKAQSLVDWLTKSTVVTVEAKPVVEKVETAAKPQSLVEWLKKEAVASVETVREPTPEKVEAVIKAQTTQTIEKWLKKKVSEASIEASAQPVTEKVEAVDKEQAVLTIQKFFKEMVADAAVKNAATQEKEEVIEPVTLEVDETQDEHDEDDFDQYDGPDDSGESSDEYEMVETEDAPLDC